MPESQAQKTTSQSGPLVAGLRAALDDPRRLAQEVIRARLNATTPFLGDGTAECPWIVFDAQGDFHALYTRGRELVQMTQGRPDAVVCTLPRVGRERRP